MLVGIHAGGIPGRAVLTGAAATSFPARLQHVFFPFVNTFHVHWLRWILVSFHDAVLYFKNGLHVPYMALPPLAGANAFLAND